MFVYTKNKYVKSGLEEQGCKLLHKTKNGIHIYAVPDSSIAFNFGQYEEYEDTWRSSTLTF